MDNLAYDAANFAWEAHKGQKRKYGGHDYIIHPARVAGIVAGYRNSTSAMIAAAWLHDTVEDTEVTILEIKSEFGVIVGNLVMELTHFYTVEDYPQWNRVTRKYKELQRLSKISKHAKSIKVADCIDNLIDIDIKKAGGFFEIFVNEKQQMYDEYSRVTYIDDKPEGMEQLRWVLSDKQRVISNIVQKS